MTVGGNAAVGILNMFKALILTFGVLATRVESGLYHNPNAIYQNQEPNYQPIIQNVPLAGNLVNYEVPEKSVSYSILANDYNYLNQYKNGLQEAQRNSCNIAGGAPAVASYPPRKKDQGVYNSGGVNDVFSASTNIANTQNAVYNSVPTVQPIIKKHIYFHVPPPDVDETPAAVKPIQPPRKTYNIIFIKTPSQQYSNAENIQSLLKNRQADFEEKTLIYVLVKKSEQPQVVTEPPKRSEHEVFYVKYKDSPGAVAKELKDSLGENHVDEVASVLNSQM